MNRRPWVRRLADLFSSRFLLPSLMLAAGVSGADAQACVGMPSFVHYRWQTHAGLELGDGGGGAANNISVAVGTGHGVLFGFGRTRIHFGDAPFNRAYGVGGDVGADLGVAREGRVRMCPIFNAERVFGPDADNATIAITNRQPGQPRARVADVESDSIIIAGGALFAYIWKDNGLKRFSPTLGLLAVHDTTSVTLDRVADPDVVDTFFELRTGLGVVLNDQMALTPTVIIPIGSDSRGVTLQILAALSFGAP